MPTRCSPSSLPVPARSVPASRRTAYSVGDSSFCHSASVFDTSYVGSSLPMYRYYVGTCAAVTPSPPPFFSTSSSLSASSAGRSAGSRTWNSAPPKRAARLDQAPRRGQAEPDALAAVDAALEGAKQVLRLNGVEAGAAIFDLEQHHAGAPVAADLDHRRHALAPPVLERVLDEIL